VGIHAQHGARGELPRPAMNPPCASEAPPPAPPAVSTGTVLPEEASPSVLKLPPGSAAERAEPEPIFLFKKDASGQYKVCLFALWLTVRVSVLLWQHI